MTDKPHSSNIVTSLIFWAGILLFAFLKWSLPDGRPPRGLQEFLAVGACISGGILLFGEAGASLLRNSISHADRAFGVLMTLSAAGLSVALIGHLIATNQGELIASLLIGAALYLVLLRNPFVVLVKV